MDRGTFVRHWYWDIDADRLAWLTFDKQGESANTFSREALEQLGAVLDEIAKEKPRGLVIRSAKDNFIAGADVEAHAIDRDGFTEALGEALDADHCVLMETLSG